MNETRIDEVATGYIPHEFQLQVHENLRRFNVLVCHRRFGKTILAINTLVDAAVRDETGAGRYAYIAPFLAQGRQIAWDYLKQYVQNIKGVKINNSDAMVELPNGARIKIYGADDPDNLRGLYFNGVVLDEVAQMRPEVWQEIIRPAISDRRGWVLFIGTPKGINLFYELYLQATMGFKTENGYVKDPEWWGAIYTIEDTNLLPEAEVMAMRRELSANAFAQEFMCDFNASNTNSLISIDTITKATKRAYKKDEYEWAPIILGIDVARYGDDRCVIFPRQGLVSMDPIVFRQIGNMEFAAKIAQVFNDLRADEMFIDAGRGEGVIDRLLQLGFSPIEVPFGSTPINPRYSNKRSEMADLCSEWLNAGGALPNNPDLKRELAMLTYDHNNAKGKFNLTSKDKMEFSTDLADALFLTFAFPVATTMKHAGTNVASIDDYRMGRAQSTLKPYDPFKR